MDKIESHPFADNIYMRMEGHDIDITSNTNFKKE